MKTKSKALLLTLCAVLLVAASILGTMAYLTSTATVTNTFTVGNVELGDKETQQAGLDEAKTNENGEPLKKSGNSYVVTKEVSEAERVQENKYKLQPGHTYTKDPTIHVGKNSDACFLFVEVKNGIARIEDSTNNIAAQMASKGWNALGNGYANIYVYVGTDKDKTAPLAVSAGKDVKVFEQFKVADTVGSDILKNYKGKNIIVTAYAVQVDGFADKAAAQIWEAAFAETVTADPDESE